MHLQTSELWQVPLTAWYQTMKAGIFFNEYNRSLWKRITGNCLVSSYSNVTDTITYSWKSIKLQGCPEDSNGFWSLTGLNLQTFVLHWKPLNKVCFTQSFLTDSWHVSKCILWIQEVFILIDFDFEGGPIRGVPL